MISLEKNQEKMKHQPSICIGLQSMLDKGRSFFGLPLSHAAKNKIHSAVFLITLPGNFCIPCLTLQFSWEMILAFFSGQLEMCFIFFSTYFASNVSQRGSSLKIKMQNRFQNLHNFVDLDFKKESHFLCLKTLKR